ncbi:MAG: ATP-dependent DNA helicase RecG [Bacteroidetes bacterium]|nr:MAG: ATP-dependent DNA helicase RecG [Bacteroidota bacterium]
MTSIFDTKIDFLKGIGPQKAAVINKELSIFTYGDLIQHYPFRHEDRTVFHTIAEAHEDMSFVQFKGVLVSLQIQGDGQKKRLTAQFRDKTGVAELVWFRAINWISANIKIGVEYVVFGKPTYFRDSISIVHPEIEPLTTALEKSGKLRPVYHSSEKMKNFGLDSKGISSIMAQLVELAKPHIKENLTEQIISDFKLESKKNAISQIHFPTSQVELNNAIYRLKFEELFYAQLKFLRLRSGRKLQNSGIVVQHIPLVNEFYKSHLPFELTNAQKKVIREIYLDMGTGKQMNRLLQGDVGSGKTIVAFICMLMLLDQNAQVCLMAPTEILADQHLNGLKVFADKLNISIVKLTGSTKAKARKEILENLANGEIKIIVGTHALIEDKVIFKNLGLCVIDEQHKFGVAQRAKLWAKNTNVASHVLVMTATPIPRTLAMAFYGDLDVSVIDELPAGRKPIKTVHRFENQRLAVIGFMKEEIKLGRQIYIVYPLIEESEKMDLQDLYNGYDAILKDFPQPEFQVSVVHGRLSPADKDFEMQRFIKGETQIMLATTVIEVGVNVPNASVMLIENAERFGLAQLHQLRGRVGRGAEQSYCILMTSNKISQDSREKLATMVRTNNGFEIAEADLKLRGPGDLMGTQQSGVLDLLIADLSTDHEILKLARETAQALLLDDSNLTKPQNQNIYNHLQAISVKTINWSRIS